MAKAVEKPTTKHTNDRLVTIKEIYEPNKYKLGRYQKRNDESQQASKFNISSKDQTMKIISAASWIKDED